MSKASMREMIIRHEGYRDEVYLCPNLFPTIGVGHKLTEKDTFKKGVKYPKETLMKILDTDIANAEFYSRMLVGDWDLPEVAKEVITMMIFQIGNHGITKFKKFLKALKEKDYATAKLEMLDSKWARSDSPHRAQELADIIGNLG